MYCDDHYYDALNYLEGRCIDDGEGESSVDYDCCSDCALQDRRDGIHCLYED